MKINTVICSLNSKYIHSSPAPWCLLAGIKAFGSKNISAKVVESTINENIEKVLSKITEDKPQYIGLSCYIWNIKRVGELVPMIKSLLPQSVVILGGPEVSYNPTEVLEKIPQADFVISGEGEKPFPSLIDALINGDSIPMDMGISTRNMVSEPYVTAETPPNPYTDEYIDNLKGRISYIESSRGCPFSCAFCLSGRCGSVRFFDLEETLQTLLRLANSGTKTIKFVDRTFNANKKRAKEIVAFIKENYGTKIPKGVCVHFEIAGDILDNELIELYQSAPTGSIQVEIGLQSFNEKTLSAVTRKTNNEVLCKNIRALLKNNNIHVHIDLIAGLPYEDFNSFGNSFNMAYSLKPHMLQMGFLKILHGSPMGEEREKYPCEYSAEPPYEVTSTPWLNENEIKELHICEFALDKLYCSGRFKDSCNFIMEQLNILPFNLYMDLGKRLIESPTPYEFCEKILDYGKEKGIDENVLRDVLVLEWISTNASGKLPKCLHISDRN